MSLRRRLRILILATLLPVAVLGAIGTALLVQREQEAFRLAAMERVHGVVAAFEADVRASVAVLEVLQNSPSLTTGDLAAFRIEAQRALAARQDAWVNMMLSTPEGRMLLNLRIPAGQPMAAHGDPDSVREVARFARPILSDVVDVAVLGTPAVAVRVPVLRDGGVRYVLSAVVDSPRLGRFLEQQRLPRGWAIGLVDRHYRFAARRPDQGQDFGPASASLRAALQSTASGWLRGRLLDGTAVYRAFEHSPTTGWAVSMAVPRSDVLASMEAVLFSSAGLLVACGFGLLLAWRLGVGIERPVTALARAAPSVADGTLDTIPPEAAAIPEVRQLWDALHLAALRVREREAMQREAQAALEAANRGKDEFLAMLGHELRNPLSAVSNAAQVLSRISHDDARVGRVGEVLQRQVAQMTRLVDDLLDAARVAAGKIQLRRELVDLGALTRDVAQNLQEIGRFQGRHFSLDVAPEAPVLGDRARLAQVVTNLLDNAAKFTRPGGAIEVSLHRVGGAAVLRVRDSGEGIPAELLERIFDLFVQARQGVAREQGGLGIGLTLARRLIELHGGAIGAESAGPGQGSAFTVTLPLAEHEAPSECLPDRASAGVPLRVLVIDDNQDARDTLAEWLRSEGHEVSVAGNGAVGVVLASSSPAPDVVFVDIGMPGMDGFEVARMLRGAPHGKRLRLVALTGYGGEDFRGKAATAGFDRFIVKPIGVEELRETLGGVRAAA